MSTIVVATNGSAACARAVERAGGLFPGSRVVVATVVREGPTRAAGHGAAVRAATHHIAVDTATGVLSEACARLGPHARAVVLTGEPGAELCRLARTEGADAIVVGSLGPGALGSALGSSVGADLRRNAPCSVVELGCAEDPELRRRRSG